MDEGKGMTKHCNAGTTTTNEMGVFPGYGKVWYDSEAIANILSLKRVKEKFRVTYDSKKENAFIVHKPDGSTIKFQQLDEGLYYLDMDKEHGAVLVNTVETGKSRYSNDDYLRARAARNLQITIGCPSTSNFMRIICKGLLPGCLVTTADVMVAEDIFGTDMGALKGKTPRRRASKARPKLIHIPNDIRNKIKDVTLCADIMFVNQMRFLITISRDIQFGTVEAMTNRKSKSIAKAIGRVLGIYHRGGYTVHTAKMDGEFEHVREYLNGQNIYLNTTARDEHVTEIERYIRTVKERVQATYNTLPFEVIPPQIIIKMVKSAVFWLNAFPPNHGVTDSMSPRTMITRRQLEYRHHCKYEFGEYVQTHEPHNNSMQSRTIGALAL